MLYLKEGRMYFSMCKAKTLEEMVNTLDLNPLSLEGTIDEFYVDATEARGADTAAKVEYILRTGKVVNKKFLFAGHSGSGKSTELFKLAERIQDRYCVVCFSISEYVNFIDVSSTDIIFAMLKSLVDVVEERKIPVDRECLSDIISYWKSESVIINSEEEKCAIETEASLGVSIGKIISSKIKALFQQSNTIKTETTTRVDKTMPQFLGLVNRFISSIKNNLEGKDLLIIVDDLDKLGEKEAYDIFKDHSVILTSIDANIIYTFPVFMHYNRDYRYISMNFDESVILSMIMVNTIDGNKFSVGRDTLKNIVLKRVDESLFEEGCIEYVVEKSGGSIRNMLKILRSATINAGLRIQKYQEKTSVVTRNDIDLAYREYKNSMKRTITKKCVPLLKEIYQSKSTINEDDSELVMDMFKTFAIIEYNCDRWCDLNPAVLDYLKELKEII